MIGYMKIRVRVCVRIYILVYVCMYVYFFPYMNINNVFTKQYILYVGQGEPGGAEGGRGLRYKGGSEYLPVNEGERRDGGGGQV